ncbi:TolB family protein [bacterium]
MRRIFLLFMFPTIIVFLFLSGCGGGGSSPSTIIKFKENVDTGTIPTSTRIAYSFLSLMSGEGEMSIYDSSTQTSTQIVSGGEIYYLDYNSTAGKIVYDFGTYPNDMEIRTISPSGSGDAALYDQNLGNFCPDWSDDGAYVAFTSVNAAGTQRDIFMIGADGTGVTQMTDDANTNFNVSWSPDGTKIVTEENLFGPDSSIVVIDVATKTGTAVTDGQGNDAYAEWSPDGSRIAFLRNIEGSYSLMIMDTTNYNAAIACTDCTKTGLFAWSADGSKIATVSTKDSEQSLYIVTVASGSVSKTDLSTYYDAGSFLVMDWSADGSKVILSSNRPSSYDPYGYAFALFDIGEDTFTLISDYKQMYVGGGIFLE